MSTLIPQSFINDLLSRVDIVEIISPRVNLRKAGNNFQALCPFHHEKTPSFTVSQQKQFYHCFGCGAHGNAISFLMDFEKLTFVEAIETLAAQMGLEVPKSNNSSSTPNQFNNLYALLEKINSFYQQQLGRSSALALNYLKQRGLSSEIINSFNLGYAEANRNHLAPFFRNNQQIQQQLLTTGMLSQKDQYIFARFHNRIMFPIRDRRGRIVGFGGRTLDTETLPKYLNSPETPLFHKGNELYGLYEAKKHNRNLSHIIVVEGYMDVIALAQHGITNVVATLGTAITPKQTQQLLQNTSTLFFCFDGDTAGKNAAWRALENILPLMHEGIEAKFLFLPENDDPDTIVRKEGTNSFNKRLSSAIALSDFLFQVMTSKTQINTLDGKAKLIKETKQLLQRMSSGIFKQLLLDKLAEITKTSIETILDYDNWTRGQKTAINHANNGNKDGNSNVNANSSPTLTLSPTQIAIGLLLHFPELSSAIDADAAAIIANLNHPEANLLLRLHKMLQKIIINKKQIVTLGAILEYWREQPEFELLSKIASWQPIISHDALKNEFTGIINKMRSQGLDCIIQSLLQKAKNNELTKEEKIKLQNLIKLTKK